MLGLVFTVIIPVKSSLYVIFTVRLHESLRTLNVVVAFDGAYLESPG